MAQLLPPDLRRKGAKLLRKLSMRSLALAALAFYGIYVTAVFVRLDRLLSYHQDPPRKTLSAYERWKALNFPQLEFTECVNSSDAIRVHKALTRSRSALRAAIYDDSKLACQTPSRVRQTYPLFFSVRNHFSMLEDLLRAVKAANALRPEPFFWPIVVVDATGCNRKYPVKTTRLAEEAYIPKALNCSAWRSAADGFEADYRVRMERPRIPWNYADNWNMIREMTMELGKDVAYWSQTDIRVRSAQTLADIALQVERIAGLDFGVAFTRYDVFCATNVRAAQTAAGDFDPFFSMGYFGEVEYYTRLGKAGLPFVQLDGGEGIEHFEGTTIETWVKNSKSQRHMRSSMFELHKEYYSKKSLMLYDDDMHTLQEVDSRRFWYFHSSLDGSPTYPFALHGDNVTLAAERALRGLSRRIGIPLACLRVAALTLHAANCSAEILVAVRF